MIKLNTHTFNSLL